MVRYRSYGDYELDWLGKVPEHWKVIPLGRIGAFSKGSGGTKEDETEEGIPSVRYGDLYTQHQFSITTTRTRISEESAARYTPIQYGDLLFAGSGETIEEIGKSAVNLITERAYCGGDVIVFRPAVEIDAAFLGYAADCSHAVYQKSCMGRGVTVMHIYAGELKQLVVPLPPLDEQRAITAFLDRETERIDSLVAKKRLLIERLEEYRTALITRAVTRGLPPEAARAAGLDPSPRLKPSGVEWLGDVPEHWGVPQLGRIARLRAGEGITSQGIEQEGEFPVFGGNGTRGFTEEYTHDGDFVLIGRQGALCGNVHIARGKFWASEHAVVATPLAGDIVSWLGYVLGAMNLSQYSIAAAQPGLAVDRINALIVPLPPPEEQSAIAGFLDRERHKIDGLISQVEHAIERLQEYRSALITAAVTGKIDVRESARTAIAGLE